MGERVKELRKALGLSGEKFGEKIGVTRSAISDIERGRNGLSDSNILAICREFNVNEEWLRTGMGEMFKDMSLDEEIISFIGEIQWDTSNTFKKRFISAISKLNEEEWNVLEKIIVDMASNMEENKKDRHQSALSIFFRYIIKSLICLRLASNNNLRNSLNSSLSSMFFPSCM